MPAANYDPDQGGVYINTIDATQTAAATFLTRPNKAYGVVATILATETADFDEQAFYIRTALFKNDGGTLALVGSVGAPTTIEATAGWDVTLDASSSTIRVLVTGAAATLVSWKVALEVHEVGKWMANAGIIEG